MSQSKIILEYLQRGHGLTTLEAVDLIGSVKLTSRISELRKAGHKIQSVKVHRGKKYFNLYFMEKKDV